jgi:DNA-directed RNA polymerase specialized sigma24 family protein
MPRPPDPSEDAVMSTHSFGHEVALAERFAALQAISIYPPAVRRQVVRQSLHGLQEATIAAELRIPITDVRAIKEAFTEFTADQAP